MFKVQASEQKMKGSGPKCCRKPIGSDQIPTCSVIFFLRCRNVKGPQNADELIEKKLNKSVCGVTGLKELK